MLPTLLLLAACGDITADDGSCRQTCLGMEDVSLFVVGEAEGTLTGKEFRALCRQAPDTIDCEECFNWIQVTVYQPFDVQWDCGCGLTNHGVRDCRDNLDMDRDQADEALDDCLATCKAEALDF